MKKKFKEFFATSWAIDNRMTVYVLTVFITALGLFSYINIPKEQFPEIVIPTIMVSTPYPGTSPEDMENLVTRPIEKQIKSLGDVKKISSTSLQDYSMIVVEFNTDIELSEAKQSIRDAVDKAKSDLPNNLPNEPEVIEIDFSEIPIVYIQLSGPYDLARLKKFADQAQDAIESQKEITRVDIVGALDREIQINMDMYKMQAAGVTLSDVERAVASENLSVSGGNITNYGMNRAIRVVGQFKKAEDINNIALSSTSGAIVYIRDVAEVKDTFKERESYSRLDGKEVITLNVIKKSGQNLLEASKKIKDLINDDLKVNVFPPDLKVTMTGDQSVFTRDTLNELNNTIIIGFVLVTLVLMFFMGFNNAFFVGLSVPLSMFLAFLVIPGFGFTMNMIVMFSFIFALGIVVDDAIVVIENTHRVHRSVPNIVSAAKMAAGEVFLPILSGTLTTLAPFFPLAFWPGIIGNMMYYLPVTLIVTLFASLCVAYIINPVFAVNFMRHEYDVKDNKVNRKRLIVSSAIMFSGGLLFHLIRVPGIGNFMFFGIIVNVIYRYLLKPATLWWQHTGWPYFLANYDKQLRFFLKGKNPYYLLTSLIVLFFLTFITLGIVKPTVRFFPETDPNNVFVLIKMPVGTDVNATDSITKVVESRIIGVLGKNNPDVESIISNVALGASGQMSFERSVSSEKGMVTITFRQYKYRKGPSTSTYIEKIKESVKGIPGSTITVEKEAEGPPTGKPINAEISGDDLGILIANAEAFERFLDSIQIPGVQELESDLLKEKPELIIDIDRERANREGISVGQIAMEIRTAVFGNEISKYKEFEDEYPIQLRYDEKTRKNIDALLNLKITYRDMNTGILRQIPLSSVAKVDYKNTYGGIRRINLKRVITLSSEVSPGYSSTEIVAKIQQLADKWQKSPGIQIKMTGEMEEQEETANFLFKTLLISLGLIFVILIGQFNSFSKSMIILCEVLFSIIGVLIGFMIFDMDISILMTGLGIVALGGIVVRNGILLVEFTDVLKERGMKTKQAIIQAGKTRITPVILTATATILGLVPLSFGMNIDFVTTFTQLDPQFHFGGDSADFWGPLTWSIIFGLSFATFLTLVFVPAMYYIAYVGKIKLKRRKSNRK